jgi:hypothetical protein
MSIRTIAFFLCCALMLGAAPVSAEFVTDIPWKNLSSHSPVFVTASSTFINPDGTVRLCVSFRNLSNKTATAARFTFEFDDLFGHPLRPTSRRRRLPPVRTSARRFDGAGGTSPRGRHHRGKQHRDEQVQFALKSCATRHLEALEKFLAQPAAADNARPSATSSSRATFVMCSLPASP